MIMGKVLIVEDEENVRRTVGLALRQGGHEVGEANDGEQAIQTIRKEASCNRLDAIIWDVALPKLNGRDVIAFMRTRLPTVPVRVPTGHADVRKAAA